MQFNKAIWLIVYATQECPLGTTIEQKNFYVVDINWIWNLNNWWLETKSNRRPWMYWKREAAIYWKIFDELEHGCRSSESKLSPTFGWLCGTKAVNLLTRTSVESNSFWREEQKRKKNPFKCLNDFLSGCYSFQFLHFLCLLFPHLLFYRFCPF